jgi:hypothetical protein
MKPALVSDASKFRDIAVAFERTNLGELVVPLTGRDPDDVKNRLINTILGMREEAPSQRLSHAYKEVFLNRPWSAATYEIAEMYFELLGQGPSKNEYPDVK